MDINEKINEVFLKTIKMYDLTIKFLRSSLSYFIDEEENVKNVTKINDDLVDKSLIEIEKTCLNIILRERPFALDLRRVTGIFKLVDDIERLGDHSEDIAWCVSNLKKAQIKPNVKSKYLLEMIEISFNMVKDAYTGLLKNDDKLVLRVLKTDDLVDDLYLKVLNELSILKEKLANNDYFIYMTLIVKYVERLADHASNIAEWVIYIKSGYYKDEVII